jgi:hypothetical protein
MKFQSVLFGCLFFPSALAVQAAVGVIRGFGWDELHDPKPSDALMCS